MARTAASVENPSLEYLAHLGPYRVARGELALAGIPGVVFAPLSGKNLPAVAFGHHWMQPIERYADTLRYFASWGIVAIGPSTEHGPLPSFAGLAVDLATSLSLIAHTRLAEGAVTVDPAKIGVAGHGLGGGAAVLAAAQDSEIKAVATVNAANTRPSAITAAGLVTVPGLHLSGGKDVLSPPEANATLIAEGWAGPVQLRTIKKASHLGLAEGKHWTNKLTGSEAERATQQVARMLMTAFFLRHLDGQEQLADDLDGKISGTKIIEIGHG
ncbi:alpha/beta hydrolase [Nakamurella antarctica]|uniref:Alpha/beta hydrolase n=1 Tax=Nakamurella antarctica TaxID=1902245 RepID=A0A3G8ZN33_9ACTN|nr:dienelactone hydrolase family protein [Nakamurella antarctica]AZI58660.1 alpha/beta hydrolase [Nakamurella antarctica]